MHDHVNEAAIYEEMKLDEWALATIEQEERINELVDLYWAMTH